MNDLKGALTKLEKSLARFETSLDDRLRQEQQFRESIEVLLEKERLDRQALSEQAAEMALETADRIDQLVAEIEDKLKQNEQG